MKRKKMKKIGGLKKNAVPIKNILGMMNKNAAIILKKKRHSVIKKNLNGMILVNQIGAIQ